VYSSIDKTIADVFFGNFDIHNKVWKDTTNAYSKWKWVLWDMDVSLNSPLHSIYWTENKNNNNNYLPYILSNYSMFGICNDKKLEVEFLNRYSVLMNAQLSKNNILYHIDSIVEILEPNMPKHIERWKHTYSIPSMEAWHKNVEVLRIFAQERHKYVYEHLLDYFKVDGISDITFYETNKYSVYIEKESLSKLAKLQRSGNLHMWNAKFFKGIPFTLTVSKHTDNKTFMGWQVNGKIVSKKRCIEYTPTNEKITIEAIY